MFDKFKKQYSVTESTVLRVYDLFPNILANTEKSKLYPSRITNYSHNLLLTCDTSSQKKWPKKIGYE